MSKIMIQNEIRKDLVYDSQCTLINKLALTKDFDIYKLTEFDRIKILMEVYQSNFFKQKSQFKCKTCGCENEYEIDFSKAVANMDKIEIKESEVEYADKTRKYKFTFAYPMVKTVSDFYKYYVTKYRNVNARERQALDNMGNIEYINLFIKKVELSHNDDSKSEPLVADFTQMGYAEMEQIISLFPQDIVYNENGMIAYITKNYLDQLNNVFEKQTCGHCGAVYDESVSSTNDFFQ